MSGDKTRDFTIGEHSGVLSVNRKLEFERKNAYQLTIQVGNKLIRKKVGRNCLSLNHKIFSNKTLGLIKPLD